LLIGRRLLLLLLLLLCRGLVHVRRMHHGGRAAPGAAARTPMHPSHLCLGDGRRQHDGGRRDRELGADEREQRPEKAQ
jgi:hypothetical protein